MIDSVCFSKWNKTSAGHRSIPVLVISLDDCTNRRKALSGAGLPNEWLADYWPARDLRKSDTQEARSKYLSSRIRLGQNCEKDIEALSTAEIGCAQSHREVAQWLVDSGAEMALVLEDDVRASQGLTAELLKINISDIARLLYRRAAADKPFVCHLGTPARILRATYKRQVVSRVLTRNSHIRLWEDVDPRESLWFSHSYIISQNAAKRYSESKVDSVADNWKRHKQLGYLQEIYISEPKLFNQDEDSPSSIGDKRHATKQHAETHKSLALARAGLVLPKIRSQFPKYI